MMQAYKNKWLPLSALALGMALSFGANAEEQKSVAVTAIVEHPALDAARDGVKEALQEAGYEDGKNLKWQYQSAQGNTGTAAQIARKFIGDKPDVIVGIATPSAQALVAATKSMIYTNTDNNVVSAYEALVKVGNDAKIPLIASDTDSVKRGAIAALGINYKEMGKQTGRMVVRILKGEKPGEIKPETSDNLQLFVNPGAAQKQGVTLSDELLKSAAEVIK